MHDENLSQLIEDAAKKIFLYCRARTSSKQEAEDLTQDILLELLRSKGRLRDEKSFYGFMWAVAGNVYKDWCKKRARPAAAELDEHASDETPLPIELLEKEDTLRILHRELGLLTEQYRKTTVLYYLDGLKVSEISKSMNISESMVKILLFKSRKILREGMNMERVKGDLSFNPGKLDLAYYGTGGNPFTPALYEDNLIAQNILIACYYDRCTVEEISLQMGVAVPYLEKDLEALCAHDVLVKRAGRYETAIVIFTKEFSAEADMKTIPLQQEIAGIIEKFLAEHMSEIKSLNTGMLGGLIKWHITQLIMEKAVLGKYKDSLDLKFPTRYAGHEAFVWGMEDYNAPYGSIRTHKFENEKGDSIRFLDFTINRKMDLWYFYSYANRRNIVFDIARGKKDGFSENDKYEIAEFIRNGFVRKSGDEMNLCIPVYTKEQFMRITSLLEGVTDKVAEKTREMIEKSTEILVQHTPANMKKEAQNLGWGKVFDIAIPAPVKILLDNGTLPRVGDCEYPTTYIVLK